jgi:hypothetical protein
LRSWRTHCGILREATRLLEKSNLCRKLLEQRCERLGDHLSGLLIGVLSCLLLGLLFRRSGGLSEFIEWLQHFSQILVEQTLCFLRPLQ